MNRLSIAASICLLAAPMPALAQQQGAGVATAVVAAETVTMAYGGASARLSVDDRVRFGADLATGPLSANVDVFDDGSRLTIGENAVVKVDRFVFAPANNAGELVISNTKGALRFVSGRMAREGVRLRTPYAYVGIRGTRFVLGHQDGVGTTVVVEEGEVEFANLAGASVNVPAGLASTISGPNDAPSPPAPPSPAQVAVVTSVNIAAAVAAPASLSLPAVAASIAGNAGAAAAAANTSPAMSGSSDFGGDGNY